MTAVKADVTDGAALGGLLRGAGSVINSVQYYFNLPVMKACLEAKVPYIDLGGLFHTTRKQLERGVRVTEVMKQKQYAPMSVAEMALSIYAVNNGYMDKVDRKKVVDFEAALQAFAKASHKASLDAINAEPVLKKHEATLKQICEDFIATGTY